MEYVFFYGGPFSQWAHSVFTLEDETFNTCEQWMMWKKAQMFGDQLTADKIMQTDSPWQQKAMGRQVKDFDDAVWMESAYKIVVDGNRAKFTQNPGLLAALKSTRGKVLVEASPTDRRWGIGLAEGAPGIEDPVNWRGDNLLGRAITDVRIELFGD
jgi:ribA/ribD-fused uncharacterized protein